MAAAADRSPVARRQVDLADGPVRYLRRGEGADVLFLHGLRTNGLLWRKVAPWLRGARSLVPDLPLGAHQLPMRPHADLSPRGLVRLAVELLDALEVERATVVGAEYGGTLAQLLAAEHPERVAGLVLTPCAVHAPPRSPLVRGGPGPPRPRAARRLPLEPFRSGVSRRLLARYGSLAKRPLDPELVEDWLAPAWTDPGIRADLRRAADGMCAADARLAGLRLAGRDLPALLAWAPESPLFPYDSAQRLAASLPRGRVVPVLDSGALVSEDRPRLLADLVEEFVAAEVSG